MTYFKTLESILLICLCAAFIASAARAEDKMSEAESYVPGLKEIINQKAITDDPKDLFKTYHPKDALPPDVWKYMHYDVDKMKEMTVELVGFTAPELAGKIAPEIKPGKYTYKDLEKYPGMKELFPPIILKNIKAGAPPISCNIQDFEIVPRSSCTGPCPFVRRQRKTWEKRN